MFLKQLKKYIYLKERKEGRRGKEIEVVQCSIPFVQVYVTPKRYPKAVLNKIITIHTTRQYIAPARNQGLGMCPGLGKGEGGKNYNTQLVNTSHLQETKD